MNGNTNPNSIPDRFETRWERRQERRSLRYGGGEWVLGIILIVVGALIYLQTMKIFVFENWWAFFILLPAIGVFMEGWRSYRAAEGKFTRRVRGSFIAGIGFTLVAAIFLFGLNWAVFGPILLVLAGACLIANGFIQD